MKNGKAVTKTYGGAWRNQDLHPTACEEAPLEAGLHEDSVSIHRFTVGPSGNYQSLVSSSWPKNNVK